MKIRIVQTQPKAGGGQYRMGEVYEFPDDVAQRWIALGIADALVEKKVTVKESTDAD